METLTLERAPTQASSLGVQQDMIPLSGPFADLLRPRPVEVMPAVPVRVEPVTPAVAKPRVPKRAPSQVQMPEIRESITERLDLLLDRILPYD